MNKKYILKLNIGNNKNENNFGLLINTETQTGITVFEEEFRMLTNVKLSEKELDLFFYLRILSKEERKLFFELKEDL